MSPTCSAGTRRELAADGGTVAGAAAPVEGAATVGVVGACVVGVPLAPFGAPSDGPMSRGIRITPPASKAAAPITIAATVPRRRRRGGATAAAGVAVSFESWFGVAGTSTDVARATGGTLAVGVIAFPKSWFGAAGPPTDMAGEAAWIPAAISPRACAKSRQLRYRSLGSLAMALQTTASNCPSSGRWSAAMLGGPPDTWLLITTAGLEPSNGGLPVSRWKAVAARAY